MMNRILSYVIDGSYWSLKCLLVAVIVAMAFTTAPQILSKRNINLPPAYLVKAQQPFADTSQLTIPEHEGERVHGAKLTPRLTGSIALWAATQLGLHPYFPATIFGLLYLLSGIIVSQRITQDRLSGLLVGVLFSGLYATSACFAINWMPKPFDGITIGMLGLTAMVLHRPGLLFLCAMLSCGADERAIMGLLFVLVLACSWPSTTTQTKLYQCAEIAGAIGAYIALRWLMSLTLGWRFMETELMTPPLNTMLSFMQAAAWTALEGGWIVLAVALYTLACRKAYLRSFGGLTVIGLLVISNVTVLDASRVGAVAFPLVLAALAVLKTENLPLKEIRHYLGLGAVISVFAPNFEIIVGTAIKWLPSYVVVLLNLG